MKVFFDKIFQLDEGYQEILIDENNFSRAKYLEVPQVQQSVNGVTYNDIYIIEPKTYYEIKLKGNTPSVGSFTPSTSWLEAGLIISNINKGYVYIYNSTHNHIYIRDGAIIGEIK